MEEQLDVAERLEPPAEPRLRAPDALRDRPDPAAVGRVQVQDSVGLRVAQRPEHYGFGLARSPHGSSLVPAAHDPRDRPRRGLSLGLELAARTEPGPTA